MDRTCLACSKILLGRSDKKFCSVACKNSHNFSLRRNTKNEVQEIDGYLHRNREILATLMGASKKEMFDKTVLSRARFRWEYLTGIYWNKEGKLYHLVYDYAWMEFSDQRILVVRKG